MTITTQLMSSICATPGRVLLTCIASKNRVKKMADLDLLEFAAAGLAQETWHAMVVFKLACIRASCAMYLSRRAQAHWVAQVTLQPRRGRGTPRRKRLVDLYPLDGSTARRCVVVAAVLQPPHPELMCRSLCFCCLGVLEGSPRRRSLRLNTPPPPAAAAAHSSESARGRGAGAARRGAANRRSQIAAPTKAQFVVADQMVFNWFI